MKKTKEGGKAGEKGSKGRKKMDGELRAKRETCVASRDLRLAGRSMSIK